MITIKFTYRGSPVVIQIPWTAVVWVILMLAQAARLIWPGIHGGAL